jgi:predicted RNA-binding protein
MELIMQSPLVRSLAEHSYLREQLLAEYRDSIDEETLRDTLEGISNLPEALAVVVRSYLDDLMVAAALGMRIDDMQERLSRIEARVEKKRATLTSVMEKADIKKLEQPDFTASLRAVPPGLLVADESVIPADYWKPQPAKLDKRGLLAALNGGASVPGVGLGNGGTTLSVRTK